MRYTLEPSYVLHARPWRESSLLLEIFSRTQGRVGLVARGARGKRSRWKNSLEPFRPLLMSWNQRTELGTLTEAEQIASPPPLTGESLFCGLYANELMMLFNQRSDPHEALFETYHDLLTGLTSAFPPQPLLRRFELVLLDSAGFGLQLEHEHESDQPLRADQYYEYIPGQGAIPILKESANQRPVVSGEALLALKSGNIEPRHQSELKALMRSLIRFSLGDRDIRSQSFFQDV